MVAVHPSVFVIYRARFYFTSARDFSVFILSGFFYHALAEKLAARTKFEVKRHFTIRAGSIAGTRRIKFVFFPISIFAKLLYIRSKSWRRSLSTIKHVQVGATDKKFFYYRASMMDYNQINGSMQQGCNSKINYF